MIILDLPQFWRRFSDVFWPGRGLWTLDLRRLSWWVSWRLSDPGKISEPPKSTIKNGDFPVPWKSYLHFRAIHVVGLEMVKTFQIKTTKNWLQNESGVFFDTHTHKFSAIGIYQAWLIWKGYLKVSKSSCKKWFHCHVDLIRLCLILCFWKKLPVLDRQIFTSFQAFWMSYTLDLKTFLFGFMGWERESSWLCVVICLVWIFFEFLG